MAKKLREEDLVLNIIVNGNKGQKEAAELGREMRDAKIEVDLLIAEQKKLEKQGRQNSTRYKEVTAEISKNNSVINTNRKRLTELGQSMKLTDQSISQLRRTLSQLNKLKNQAVPGSEQYKRYEMQIQAINNRLQELGVRARGTGTALNRMGSGISRYFGGITAGIASITSIVFGFRKAIDEFARFDDQLADVQKTTNLTKGEVKELSDELENIRTRTSQEDLLGLARIGGKLGMSDQNELVGFVDSMNKIVVALNEDLGGNVEETVNQMGKLVDIFGVKEIYGIEQSILKVGSAINELGMASTANEGYLVDLTQRMAGVAPLADISIQEILGLAATLDQFGQSAEVSGTALSKLFLDMSKDAASFAKYAGMEVNDFKDLLEKDFMGAFTRVLSGIKGNSAGINQLAATLDDLGIDGNRVIGVIGTLADNHHVLTEQINLSTQAFEEGTSVIAEYEVKNETAAARLEMSRKEVTKFWRELGEKLYPTMTAANNLLVNFLRALMALIDFISNNIKWISIVTAAIFGYTVAVNASTVATKIATIATTAFNRVIKANPIGLLVSVLAAAATALYVFSQRASDATIAQQTLSKAQLEGEKASLKERTAIERNTKVLDDNKASVEEKLAAIQNLRKIMPDVLKDYTDEEILSGKATTAIDKHTKAIRARAKARAYENKITALHEELLEIEAESAESFGSSIWNNLGNQIRGAFTGRLGIQVYQEDLKNRRQTIETELTLLEDALSKETKLLSNQNTELTETVIPDEATVTPTGGSGGKSNKDKTKESAENERKKWEAMLEMLQQGAQKYRERQLNELDRTNAEVAQKDNEAYLAKLQAIDQMNATEQEKAAERELLLRQQEELDRFREQEKLNQRWLLLQNFETIGDLEIDEAQRIADEKLQIEKQLTDNAIAEQLRLAKQREEYTKRMAEAETNLSEAVTNSMVDSLGAMKDLFKGNEALAKSFLVLEKLAAAAHVITSLQREIAGYYAAYAMIPGGIAIATKMAAAAKIRAGASLVTIAAQTISGLTTSGNSGGSTTGTTPQRSTPRYSGRERGGFLVQRDQDGKKFNARFNPFKRGYVGGPTVIVGENGSEFVANAQAVANPSIKPLLDVIDIAQRNGSISTLNLENILLNGAKMQMKGLEAGGATNERHYEASTAAAPLDINKLIKQQNELSKVVEKLSKQIDKGIVAEVALLGKNGFIAKQEELNNLENKASL